jgi:hypothetical protein
MVGIDMIRNNRIKYTYLDNYEYYSHLLPQIGQPGQNVVCHVEEV